MPFLAKIETKIVLKGKSRFNNTYNKKFEKNNCMLKLVEMIKYLRIHYNSIFLNILILTICIS